MVLLCGNFCINHVHNSKHKGIGALYFGIGTSLISSGAILIHEGLREAKSDK